MAKFTWKGSPVVKRQGIVLDPEKDVPWPCHMAYNAGIVKFGGRYAMLFRNIYWNERYGKSTRSIGRGFSDDGIHWDVDEDFRFKPEGITNPEDPRLIVVEGRVYVTFTENSRDGIQGCIAVTDDLENYEMLSMSDIKLPEGVSIPALAQGPEQDRPIVSIHVIKEVVIEEEEELEPGAVPVAGEEEAAPESSDDSGDDDADKD